MRRLVTRATILVVALGLVPVAGGSLLKPHVVHATELFSDYPIPLQATEPVFDGSCVTNKYPLSSTDPLGGAIYSMPTTPANHAVFFGHSTDYFYLCFLSPPDPIFSGARLSIYVLRDDAAGGGSFVVSQPLSGGGASTAATWNPATGNYDGPDPGGATAILAPCTSGCTTSQSAEFRISRATMGGWQRRIRFAALYESYASQGDNYGWPNNTSFLKIPTPTPSNGAAWTNLHPLPTHREQSQTSFGPLTVPESTVVPALSGYCNSASNNSDYRDALSVPLQDASGSPMAWYKHTATDLYICLEHLAMPSGSTTTDATVFINRAGYGGETLTADDTAFTITQAGASSAHQGGTSGFNGPDPGGYSIVRAQHVDQASQTYWDAEYRISQATLGGGAWDRPISIGFAEHSVSPGVDIRWPITLRDVVSDTSGLAFLSTSAAPGLIDLHPTAIEVTQSIQDLNNTVVLVADRRTFARVHVTSNQFTSTVQARLTASRNGVSLGASLVAANKGGTIDIKQTPDRGNLDDSFYFELPASWTKAGAITLTAEINPDHLVRESFYTNDVMTTPPLTFVQTKALKIKIFRYEYDCSGCIPNPQVPAENALDVTEALLRTELPISKLDITRGPPVRDTSTDADCVSCFVYNLVSLRDATPEPGVLWLAVANSTGGVAFGAPGWTAVGNTATVVHEVGHLLGRAHTLSTSSAPCSRSSAENNPDPNYPYPNGAIGGPAGDTARYYGLRATGGTPEIIANATGDLMSYCLNRWTSDYTYTGIHNYIQSTFTGFDPAGDFLALYGSVNLTSKTVDVLNVARQAQVETIPPLTPGPYHVQLFDASDQLLADSAFTLGDTHDDATGIIRGSIDVVVPFVTGTRRIAIYSDGDGHELKSIPVSASPPTVTATSMTGGSSLPASGAVTLNWTGTDPAGGSLNYSVLYSSDGKQTWQVVTAATPNTSATFDLATLPGTHGAANGWFRVIANNGALTANAESGPFTVAGKPPVAQITSPDNNRTYVYGQTVTLEGYGRDVQDGSLDDAHLAWSSDRDGNVGAGHLLYPSLLSPGLHTLTLTATNADGQVGSATTHVVILSRRQADQTITFTPLATKTFGDPPFAVSATATSGLAVAFAVSGNCSIAGSTVTITGAGTCSVTASQAGDANYAAAPDVVRTFTINKAGQTITFAAISVKSLGDPPFLVAPTSSSGLAVSLAASGPCSVASFTVSITGGGRCTLTASQPGNTNYSAAAPVVQSFAITCTPQQFPLALLVGSSSYIIVSLSLSSQAPSAGDVGCQGAFTLLVGQPPKTSTIGTGSYGTTTSGTSSTMNLTGKLVPLLGSVPFTGVLQYDVASGLGQISIGVRDSRGRTTTVVTTFALRNGTFVITGVRVIPPPHGPIAQP